MGIYLARAVLGAVDSVTVALVGVGFHTAVRAARRHRRVVLCLVVLAVFVLGVTALFGLGWYAGIGAGVALGFWAGHWAARH